MDAKEIIARRAAQELNDGDVVNLGFGVPNLVSEFVPSHIHIIFDSENGVLGMGPAPKPDQINPDIVNSGAQPATVLPGASYFDSAMSFGLIRGGHIDVTILGALEVDQEGNLANWKIPSKMVPGMGGAMDLVIGAKKVIVAMTHTQGGAPKIVKRCLLPLTAAKEVNVIITELAFFQVTDQGLVLMELGPGATVEMVREQTGADFIVSPNLKSYQI